MSDTFIKGEVEILHKGAMGAGLLVSVSDHGFFDAFKEARSDEKFADGTMRWLEFAGSGPPASLKEDSYGRGCH